jgi:hypothetical protein
MRYAGKRWRPEDWLQWQLEDWGGAEMPIDPPAAVVTGAANRLTKTAVRQWLVRPVDGLWGCMIAADSLQQQWAVQKRIADRQGWRKHFAAKNPPEKAEWPKGANARNHTHWKWMELRAREHIWREEMARKDAMRQQQEWVRRAAEAADTHPWAHREDIRAAWSVQEHSWRAAAVWRSTVYACWRELRPGRAAWPIWMQPQAAGKKGKPRQRPRVDAPQDNTHPHGRNRGLREVFEGLPTRADQETAIRVMTPATGSAPDWMILRQIEPPKRPGRPRKAT